MRRICTRCRLVLVALLSIAPLAAEWWRPADAAPLSSAAAARGTGTDLIPGPPRRTGAAGATEVATSPSFVVVPTDLPMVWWSGVAWGDCDNDGDLDLAITGQATTGGLSRIYRNDAGALVDMNAGLPAAYYGTVVWGDYDRDGDLDLLLSGDTGSGYFTRIYRNNGHSFSNINAGLPGAYRTAAAWGDYDNDGDLDLVLTGTTGAYIANVYRNDAGTFHDIGAGLPGVYAGAVAWGDYDNDGDIDLVLTGLTSTANVSRVYRNDAGAFNDIGAGLPGVQFGAVAWGDYDNDGDLDLAIQGGSDAGFLARVYRNDGGAFSDIAAGLPAVYQGAVVWGDYDNDGDLDLALTGTQDAGGRGLVAGIYRNDAGAFTDIGAGLSGVFRGSAAAGDYDNDGDLDLLVTGYKGPNYLTTLYRNDATTTNTQPSDPGGLVATVEGERVTLSWSASTDLQTPPSGLSYNMRVGTTPGADEVGPGMAATTGLRRVVQLGNAQQRTSWTLRVPPATGFYWSVQSVDGAFAGSAFAAEQRFATYTLGIPVEGMGTVVKSPNQATYDIGTEVTLTAFPEAGWRFAGWRGDLLGSVSPTPVAMDANKSVTATFAASVGTELRLASSPNPSLAGRPVTLIATITPANATGAVEFFFGAASLGTTALAGGMARLVTSALPQGSNALRAVYVGEVPFEGSTSPRLVQVVRAVTRQAKLPTRQH